MIFDQLYPFQKRCVVRAMPHRGFLINLPTGCGKTVTSLAIIERRWRRGQVNRVLIVVPLSLKTQWKEEIRRWLPEAKILPLANSKSDPDELAIFVTHYEFARTDKQLHRLRKKPFDLMLCDEGHKLKSRGSKQSRRLWLIGKTCQYRLELTGSPVESDEIDLWPQMRFLDERLFGSKWADFTEEYCYSHGWGGFKKSLKREKRQEFLDKIARITFTINKSDALELPPVIHTPLHVELTGRQRKLYDEMEKTFLAEIGDTTIAAPMVVVQMIRLQQMTGGYVTDEEGVDHLVGTAKIDALRDVILAHPRPIVVFARFTWEIMAIAEMVKSINRVPSILTGKLKVGNHKQFDILICQIAVMAGLDEMQNICSTAVFYSKTYSRIQYDQAIGRLDRNGQQAGSVLIISINAKSSIDDAIQSALSSKGNIASGVLAYFKGNHNE